MTEPEARPEAGPIMAPRMEVETLSQYGMEDIDFDYDRALQVAEKKANFVKAIRKAAVQQTYATDWLARKLRDGSYSFDLMGPGAERVHTFAPIGFMGMARTVEEWTKEDGRGYTIRYEAQVYLGPKTHPLPVIGTCSSDDDFFSTEHVELPYNADNAEHAEYLESGEGRLSQDRKTLYIKRRIPSSEVTRENIDKSALTNLVVNGVTRILGIRRMSADQLKEWGIDVSKIATVDYGSKREQSGRLSPAEEQRRGEIWRMLLEMANGDEKAARAALKVRSAFGDREGVEDVARFTAKQIAFHFDKVLADYNRWKGEAPHQAPAKGPQQARPSPKAKDQPPPEETGQRDLL